MDSLPLLLSFFFLLLFFFPILVAFCCVCCFFQPNQKLRPFTYPVLNLRRLVIARYPSCSVVCLIPGANWVCRSGFFKAKCTLFYWSPPLVRNSTVLPNSPASQRCPPLRSNHHAPARVPHASIITLCPPCSDYCYCLLVILLCFCIFFYLPCIFIFLVFCSSFCFLLLVCFMGCCLLAFRRFGLFFDMSTQEGEGGFELVTSAS